MISSFEFKKNEFEKKDKWKKKLIRFLVVYDIFFYIVDFLSKCYFSYIIIWVFFISYFVYKECICISFVCWFLL